MNQAVEEYFLKGHGETATVAVAGGAKSQQAFDRYKDSKTGKIEMDGIIQFFNDLGVNGETDAISMYFPYKMNAASMGEFTAAEFKQGFTAMGVSTVDELKRKLPQLYQELKNPEDFKKMYKFVFDFARDKTFKNLQVEMAFDLWELLIGAKARFLKDWVQFLQAEKTDQKVVTKDTWNMLLELVEQTRGDLANFVDDGTWPPLIDQFVEYHTRKYA